MLENLVANLLAQNLFYRLIGRRRSLPFYIRDSLLKDYNLMFSQQKVRYNGHSNPYEEAFYNHVKSLKDNYWDLSFYEMLIKKYEVEFYGDKVRNSK